MSTPLIIVVILVTLKGWLKQSKEFDLMLLLMLRLIPQ
ncbi:dTDP-4-dehydrorhamnose reductase domain protein [Escherichia coli P0299438.6]|nr:dTDP-4-dehydrorhamnose reductase domain protein [Escherichia coli P0299438.6]ENC18180.1 dTDP-4-dehydrorhamnose reductase domain protein [Escherichia coli P0299438.7]